MLQVANNRLIRKRKSSKTYATRNKLALKRKSSIEIKSDFNSLYLKYVIQKKKDGCQINDRKWFEDNSELSTQ